MPIRISIFITLLVILTASSVFSQGSFLHPGESGFGASGVIATGDNTDGYGFSFGTSTGGFLDLTFSYSNDDKANAHAYSPSLTFYVKEEENNRMLGIGFTGGYVRLEANEGIGSADYALAGVTLFANFYTSGIIAIQPQLSGSLMISLQKETNDRTITSLDPGLTIIFGHKGKLRPFLGASYSITEESDDNYFSIGGGLVAAW